LDFLITGGQVNDCTQAIELLSQHKVEAVLADKGYDADAIVAHVEAIPLKCAPLRMTAARVGHPKDSIPSGEML
jgi:transposase